uniref:Stress response protein NST1-like n=1 Tax=Cicer arietinum TaxID=3827 RepID=A0A1S3DWU2_CICAR|nr:stress response protein NST1-like [Cicer arietinum]
MKIKAFNLCFLCALFLLSVVATETLKEGKQYTKESKKNVLVDKLDGGRKPIDIESFDQNKPVGAGNLTREERIMALKAEMKAKMKEREAKKKEREAKLKELEAKKTERKLHQNEIALAEEQEKKKREKERQWEILMLRKINKLKARLAARKLLASLARAKAKANAKHLEMEAKQKAKEIAREERERKMGRVREKPNEEK